MKISQIYYIFLSFIKLIFSLPINEFSMQYIISIRIKNKQDLNFLLDTTKSDSIFFSDTNKNGYNNLPNNYFSDFITSIEINTFNIKNFKFKIENDNTNLNNQKIQGIIGLGIKDYRNSLLDRMKEEKIINNRIIFFYTKPKPIIKFHNEISNKIKENYTGCYLNSDNFNNLNYDYSESWNCDLSHIYIENKKKFNDNIFNNESKIENNITLNDTIKVNSKVIFDAKSYYISTSVKYLDLILKEFNFKNNCSTFFFNGYYYISCNINEENLNKIPFISFIFEGYAYKIRGKKFFVKNKNNTYYSLIRFSNDTQYHNIFILGYPFFSSYKIKFDYDKKFIAFNGEVPIDLTNIIKDQHLQYNIVQFIGYFGIILVIILLTLIFINSCFLKKKNKSNIKLVDEEDN